MNVEKQVFDKIKIQLRTALLPMRLTLESPTLPPSLRTDKVKRRKRRKHRSKAPMYTSERTLRLSANETRREPSHRTPQSRGNRDYKDLKQIKQRRMSTGSWQYLQDVSARASYEMYPPLSTIYSNEPKPNKASDEMK